MNLWIENAFALKIVAKCLFRVNSAVVIGLSASTITVAAEYVASSIATAWCGISSVSTITATAGVTRTRVTALGLNIIAQGKTENDNKQNFRCVHDIFYNKIIIMDFKVVLKIFL
jgi:hypothetical protein